MSIVVMPSRSVLIVEDERIIALDLQQALVEMGYGPIAIASSAEEALASASDRRPDVVLMDIRIKGERDGIETADILRRSFRIPCVYLTAHADVATLERAKRTEPYGYLVKPVIASELRSAIEISIYRFEIDERVRARERWFSTTLRSIADAVISVDLAGRITFMNPVAERLTGMTAERAIGRPAAEVVRLLDAAQPGAPFDEVLLQKKAVMIEEARLGGAEGSSHVISDSTAPVIEQGELIGAVMVFRDVTEQKRLQKQLELADRMVSLGTLAAGIGHEVNNPLTVVAANAEFVAGDLARTLEELRSTEARDAALIRRLEEAHAAQLELRSAAARIQRIVADLREFSRPPDVAGQADVARAVEWTLRTTAAELRSRARVVTALSDLPPLAINETRLGQILVNLVLNAAHAITPGHVAENQISIAARSASANEVVIEVRDTGCGMTPDVLAHIFEPFFTTKTGGLGTGLGLSICHGIARSAGGELSAESKPGEGSTFRLRLPVATKPPPPAKQAALPSPRTRGAVLVVDDDEMVLRTFKRVLDQHELACTRDAREALQWLRSGRRFDVILSDVMMPGMNGMEFYEQLLRTHPEDAARLVFISGGSVPDVLAEFLATIPNARFDKPFGVEQLRNLVAELVAARRQQRN